MARKINLDQKLSAEDKRYLLARGREDDVLQNEARFGNEAAAAALLAIPGTTVDRAPGVLGTPTGTFDTDPRRAVRMTVEGGKNDPFVTTDPDEALQEYTKRRQLVEMEGMGGGPSSFVDQNRPITQQSVAAQQGIDPSDLQSAEDQAREQQEVAAAAAEAVANQGAGVGGLEPEADGEDNYDDEEAWSYKELQAEAKNRDLNASGSREDLIARLREDDAEDDE